MSRHYDRKVLILIDEYDVPLAKANEQGFYDEMVFLLRNFFENALKTNEYLKFAVLTGVPSGVRESIFTGLNNFGSIQLQMWILMNILKETLPMLK